MSKIFFSWQSDLPQNATTRAIRSATSAAATGMTEKFGELISVEEATSNSPGSPDITREIAKKIQASDIFIGDITSVTQMVSGKSLPNPNVTFELGLAVAHLGWDRIILLFNEEIAEFDKLPFDFDHHRISKYKMAEANKIATPDQKKLTKLVTLAVQTILDQKPLRPCDLEGKSETQIKRERDIVNIKWFMRHINIDMLGTHIREMPKSLHGYATVMADSLGGVVNSPSFSLYDQPLEKNLRSLCCDLNASVSFSELYRDSNSPWLHILDLHGSGYELQDKSKAASKVKESTISLAKTLNLSISNIRTNYLEINLDETSAEFARVYWSLVNFDEKG